MSKKKCNDEEMTKKKPFAKNWYDWYGWLLNYILEPYQLKNILIKLDHRPFLKDIINNLKKSDAWKTQLTIAMSFTSFKDIDEDSVMSSKSRNHDL